MSNPELDQRDDWAMRYHRVASSPEGRLVLEHIITRLCLTDTVFRSSDAMVLAEHVAGRNIGLMIRNLAYGELRTQKPGVSTDKPEVNP